MKLIQKLGTWERRSERHLPKKQLICFISLKWRMLWWFLFTMARRPPQWSWRVRVFNTINLIRTSSVINRPDFRGAPLLAGPWSPFAYQFVAKDIRIVFFMLSCSRLSQIVLGSSICKLVWEPARRQREENVTFPRTKAVVAQWNSFSSVEFRSIHKTHKECLFFSWCFLSHLENQQGSSLACQFFPNANGVPNVTVTYVESRCW